MKGTAASIGKTGTIADQNYHLERVAAVLTHGGPANCPRIKSHLTRLINMLAQVQELNHQLALIPVPASIPVPAAIPITFVNAF